jgi:hypothetical protein
MLVLGQIDDVTLASLVVASMALFIALYFFYLLRTKVRNVESAVSESDAIALVQEFSRRSRKLEERLVEQKVRLEILELRQQRQIASATQRPINTDTQGLDFPQRYYPQERSLESSMKNVEGKTREEFQSESQATPPREPLLKKGILRDSGAYGHGGGQMETNLPPPNAPPTLVPTSLPSVTPPPSGAGGAEPLVRSEVEALRFVLDAGSKGATAREIQSKIGRSREHTARMMNALFKQGFVERSSAMRPYTYKITEKGRKQGLGLSL